MAELTDEETPTRDTKPAQWLEVPEAALLLETARTYKAKRKDLAVPFAYELLATLLLTGARPKEALGLELADVNFNTGLITIRPNDWRGLKTTKSERKVPLWPQLAEILKPHCQRREREGGTLLFPTWRQGKEAMLGCVPRKMLRNIGKAGGWKKGELYAYMFRHTYASARAMTLDHGQPVSPFTVSEELGHKGLEMIIKTYFHHGRVRHRAKAVEYRVEQHKVQIRTLLKARKLANGRLLRLVA